MLTHPETMFFTEEEKRRYDELENPAPEEDGLPPMYSLPELCDIMTELDDLRRTALKRYFKHFTPEEVFDQACEFVQKVEAEDYTEYYHTYDYQPPCLKYGGEQPPDISVRTLFKFIYEDYLFPYRVYFTYTKGSLDQLEALKKVSRLRARAIMTKVRKAQVKKGEKHNERKCRQQIFNVHLDRA